jgi:hypothetical protein
MHAKSFTKARVPYRTFAPLVEAMKQLALLQHVDGHEVSSEPEDTGKFAARFRATPTLLSFCSERAVEPAKVFDHFEFEYDLPKVVLELRATKEGDYWVKTKPVGKPMEFERDGIPSQTLAAFHGTPLGRSCRMTTKSRQSIYGASKRSHLVALRQRKISASNPPSTWWPEKDDRPEGLVR